MRNGNSVFRLTWLSCTILAAGFSQAQSIEGESTEPAIDHFARDSFRIDKIVCPFKGDIEYEPGEIECGLLQVPENREIPDSRFIELHFVKLNSTWDDEAEDDDEDDEEETSLAPGRRDDVVIYLTGGPGVHVKTYIERV